MNEKMTGLAEKLFAILMILALFYITMRILLPLSLPFIIAYLTSRVARPVSRAVRARAKALDKPATVLFLIVIFLILFIFARFVISATLDQLSRLMDSVVSDFSASGGFSDRLTDVLRDVASHTPFLKKDAQFADKTVDLILSFAHDSLSYISRIAADAAGDILTSLPSFFIGLFVMLTATFYFSLDRGSFGQFIDSCVPERYREKLGRYRDVAVSAAIGYLKTYLLMMLVVFTVLYLGFTVIGINYALVIALITALVDLLPVLGVGTVIVPWATLSLFLGDVRLAVSLMILFAVVTVVRELLEPKIIGGYIGIHPILALVSVYFGMRLFGVAGLVASPIILSMILSLVRAEREDDKESAPAQPERNEMSNGVMLSGLSARSRRRPVGKRRTSDPSARR